MMENDVIPFNKETNDEHLKVTILDNIEFEIFKHFDYKLKDVVQFHSKALYENQVMSNHYNCIVTFRGVEFYGFEMLFAALRLQEHPEVLKDLMGVTSTAQAIKKSDDYADVYYKNRFEERRCRVYVLSQLFKYLSVKEYRDRLRELRGKTLVECPNGHGMGAEATQDLDTNVFHGRNYSGRFTMLIRDMMLDLEDEAIAKRAKALGRQLTAEEQEAVILEVCEQVRDKYENLPQVKADTDVIIDYIKDPRNGISLKRKPLLKKPVRPAIDWEGKALVVDFDGCLFDTSVDDDLRKNVKGARDWDAIYKLIPQYKLYDGWKDLLAWAKAHGVKIGILCDAQRTLVEKTMAHFKLPYDVVVGFQPYLDYPNPIRGNQMMNKLAVREKQVLYIGTSKDSEKQARCCQFKFVGGTWGADGVKDLKVPLIDSPKAAVKLLEESKI